MSSRQQFAQNAGNTRSMNALNTKEKIKIQPNAYIQNHKRAAGRDNFSAYSNPYGSMENSRTRATSQNTLPNRKDISGARTSQSYGTKVYKKARNILNSSISNPGSRMTRNRLGRYKHGHSTSEKKFRGTSSEKDSMTRNYHSLSKMNNTTAPSIRTEKSKDQVLSNVFNDYTAG